MSTLQDKNTLFLIKPNSIPSQSPDIQKQAQINENLKFRIELPSAPVTDENTIDSLFSKLKSNRPLI